TGNLQARQITDTITGDGLKHLVTLTVDPDGKNGKAKASKITATANHLFWLPDFGKWVTAEQLEPGMWLQTAAGTWVQVTAVDRKQRTERVHNLTVDGVHTYFVLVGDAAIPVHNEGIEEAACKIGKPGNAGIPRHAKKKTGGVAGDKSYPSGWSAKKPKSFEKMDIANVSNARVNMGMPQTPHSWDGGVIGRYNNSHVEKQAIVDNGGKSPIAVDRDMCGDCREFATWYAYRNDVDIAISDPSGVRIFRRTGDVEFLLH
ncbi:polymorphic toxin-type HINT domain-containing protein, partial [Streptomyces sp. NPDC002523]